MLFSFIFFFSSRRRHTRFDCDWSSDVCSSDLVRGSTFQTIEQDLDAITAGNTMAIDQWVASKARAVSAAAAVIEHGDRKSTRLNSSHSQISYAVFCLKKKKKT